MKYALLIYNRGTADDETPEERRLELDPAIAAVLERPSVTGWVRLHAVESATTVSRREGRTLLTDGPFIDSKEFLAGLIVVEAENLDGALAAATELQEMRPATAIEVRPVLDEDVRGA